MTERSDRDNPRETRRIETQFLRTIAGMMAFLQKRWFLVALALLIPLGLIGGMQSQAPSGPPTNAEQTSSETKPSDVEVPVKEGVLARLKFSQIITAVVLLLMAFSLDTHHLKAAVRSPGPVLWASLVNYGGIPLLAWGLSGLQQIRDFQIGLMIAGTVPCTLAAASVWTRKARGNDAVSLMVTLLTNTICFLATPFWLNLTLGHGVTLNTVDMIFRLLFVVLLPTLAGQGLRQIPRLGQFAARRKTPIGVVAQIADFGAGVSSRISRGQTTRRRRTASQLGGSLLSLGQLHRHSSNGNARRLAGQRSDGFLPREPGRHRICQQSKDAAHRCVNRHRSQHARQSQSTRARPRNSLRSVPHVDVPRFATFYRYPSRRHPRRPRGSLPAETK